MITCEMCVKACPAGSLILSLVQWVFFFLNLGYMPKQDSSLLESKYLAALITEWIWVAMAPQFNNVMQRWSVMIWPVTWTWLHHKCVHEDIVNTLTSTIAIFWRIFLCLVLYTLLFPLEVLNVQIIITVLDRLCSGCECWCMAYILISCCTQVVCLMQDSHSN